MAYQKVIVEGNLGADPEMITTPSGTVITTFSVACGEKWKDKKTGEMKEHTEWFRLKAFDHQAKHIAEFFKKGSGILVEGTQRTDKFQDKETGADRYSTMVLVRDWRFPSGSGKGNDSAPSAQPAPQRSQQGAPPASTEFGDDIPFLPYMHKQVI